MASFGTNDKLYVSCLLDVDNEIEVSMTDEYQDEIITHLDKDDALRLIEHLKIVFKIE